jgi:hypothetical protein
MPCPYFEPTEIAASPTDGNARLPLIDEYSGFCHADPLLPAVPVELRFRCCNHGYSERVCSRYPAPERRSCARFTVLERSAESLNVLYIEERHHAPVAWRTVRFAPSTQSLEPELDELCARAQLLAFCRAYLRRFAPQAVPHNGEYGNGTAVGGAAL